MHLKKGYPYTKYTHFQLLADADLLSADSREMMFTFFKDKVVPVILKYQLTAVESQTELTREDIESVLCTAVKDQPTSSVSVHISTV